MTVKARTLDYALCENAQALYADASALVARRSDGSLIVKASGQRSFEPCKGALRQFSVATVFLKALNDFSLSRGPALGIGDSLPRLGDKRPGRRRVIHFCVQQCQHRRAADVTELEPCASRRASSQQARSCLCPWPSGRTPRLPRASHWQRHRCADPDLAAAWVSPACAAATW